MPGTVALAATVKPTLDTASPLTNPVALNAEVPKLSADP